MKTISCIETALKLFFLFYYYCKTITTKVQVETKTKRGQFNGQLVINSSQLQLSGLNTNSYTAKWYFWGI